MTTRTYHADSRHTLQLLPSGTLGLFGWLKGRLLRWQALSRQRRALAELDNRLLADVGLDRTTAAREAAAALVLGRRMRAAVNGRAATRRLRCQ